MQLPEALHPWRQWLEWFAPEQLPLFADLLGRLNPLLGPLRGLRQGGVPEPDGLGDLQRRGPYERLLSSEWLLAEELPDEFLRRAVGGEHMFLAPQYRAKQANRLIVVLFDAGPLQLGAARLVHLALMMLLARRAQEAGAELRWGILQEAPRLHELHGVAQLKQLLEARTYEVVGDEHWLAWRAFLAEQPETAGECWLVGQRLPATDSQSCSHRVQVKRSLDGQSLMFEMQAASSRKVMLPLPDERLALQLLKGQFAGQAVVTQAKGTVPRVGLTLQPVISAAGTHIALNLLDEPGMVVIKLPTVDQKKAFEVRTHLWAAERDPLAITFIGRGVGAVLTDEQTLSFWSMPSLMPIKRPDRDELSLPIGTANLLPCAWLRRGNEVCLFLLDNQGRMARWGVRTERSEKHPTPGKYHSIVDRVLGLAKVDRDAMAYVRNDGGRWYAHVVGANGYESPGYSIGAEQGVKRVLFAAAPQWWRSFGGCALLTVENNRERWQVITPASLPMPAERIDLLPGWSALGLVLQKGDTHYSLVVLSADKQTVGVYCDGRQRVLFTTSQSIAKVSFCPVSGLVVALTKDRELLVYAVEQQQMRLQVFCNHIPAKNQDRDDE